MVPAIYIAVVTSKNLIALDKIYEGAQIRSPRMKKA